MTDRTSRLIVRLIDGVSGPAKIAAQSLAGLQKVGRATVALGGAKQIAANARAVVANVKEVGATLSAPIALVGAIGAKTAFEFERAGNFLEALGEATGDQRKEFEAMANVLNAKYPQSLTEILKTGTELLKAGLDWKQMLGAMDPTLATAILGDMKPSEVATMISAALNAFQMPMETTKQALQSTTTVADRLTYSAVKSTATLREMGEMFKYVAGAAAATGNGIDDVTAFAMAFSKNKVNGMEAGVALRSAIVRMAKGGTKQGRAALERAGMSYGDYNKGQQKVTSDRVMSGLMAGGIDATPIKAQLDALVNDPSLANAPVKLAAKVTALVQEHLTKSGSAMDASVISEAVQESIVAAGSKIDLMRFFMDLKKKVADGVLSMGDLNHILEGRHFAKYQAILQNDLEKLKADIVQNSAGFTEERYKIVLKGIVGPVYELSAAFEGLAVAMGKSVFKDVAAGIRTVSQWVEGLSTSSPEILRFATYAGMALAILGPLGIAITGTTAVVGLLAAAVRLLTGAMLMNPIGLIVVGIAAVAAGVYYFRNEIMAAFNAVVEFFGRVWASVSDFFQRINAALVANGGAGGLLYNAGVSLFSSLWEGMKAKWGELIGWVSGIGASIKSAIGLGGAPAGGGATATPPGRAMGGNVTRGRAYRVGERRRTELFFPGVSGTIHPTDNIGGGRSVSVSINPVFHINGAQDARDVAEEAYRILESRTREMFRGIFADTGLRFT